MDGAINITQRPAKAGETFTYEFVGRQAGAFYRTHDHPDRQQALGLYGALIIDLGTRQPTCHDLEHVSCSRMASAKG
jgi:FtsP/CotA-like multicopper oxidase with cupredoxin domain